ncbi:MAG TPA: hypothetical protein VJA21_01855 [Verrucomicrobiae bacterium]
MRDPRAWHPVFTTKPVKTGAGGRSLRGGREFGVPTMRLTTGALAGLLLAALVPSLTGAERPGRARTNRPAAAGTSADWFPAPAVREVIVVFKTHFDIGYTDLATNVVEKYRTKMIDEALDVADRNRDLPPAQQFVWTIPGWPLHKIMEEWPGQTAERKARLQRALKEGRFVVHALPFSTHTELLEAEDLVRGLGYSSRLARGLGQDLPRDAKMTDVPEHTWMLATLLHHAGVAFMHIGCNSASAAPRVPPLYWWEGPDGSRVLTMYSPAYGTGLLPPANWPYHAWLALQHTGDNHGPPRPDEVKRVLEELGKKMPGVKVRIGRLSDFGDAILAEHAKLPVVRADTPDTWIHGPMSDPAGARLARNTRPLIAVTEALNTELRAWGLGVPDATSTVAAAYEQSLLYGEHTWGGSIGWLKRKFGFGEEFQKERSSGRFDRIESSWEEHSAYIRKAKDLIDPVLHENLEALAGAVNVSGPRVVVYNPLPWKRSGLVTVGWRGPPVTALQPADRNETMPAAITHAGLRFVASDVPPLGYRVFVPTGASDMPSLLSADSASATMEGPFFRAAFDLNRGTIRSLVDKKTGHELVDDAAAQGFGQYLYERFDSNQVYHFVHTYLKYFGYTFDFEKPGLPPAEQFPYRAASPASFKLRFEKTPVSVVAVMEAPAGNGVPNPVTTRLTIYRDLPCADLEITLHDKPLDPWPEAGWLCLPFKADSPQFHLGRLGSIIDPAHNIVPGANRYLFAINTGVAIVGARGNGAAFCPLDNPLVSLEVPGCWRFSTNFVPRKPVAFVNLFNNQWNTNFRLWNSGTWTSRVRLWGLRRYEAGTGLITPSLEHRYPLQAAAADGPGGRAPQSQKGMSLSRQGVILSAFGRNPDGEGTILRLWESAGRAGKCRVELPAVFRKSQATPVDLRGRPTGKPIQIDNGAFTVRLQAFAPASYRLEPEP